MCCTDGRTRRSSWTRWWRALNQLTAQELQIARLVAGGASNRDVATRLFLSPRTVEYHLYKIYPKLGVASRMELAQFLATEQALTPTA